MTVYCSDCAAMSGTPRPPGLRKFQSKNGLCRATGANARVFFFVLSAQTPDIGFRIRYLVFIDGKVIREAAPGDDARDFGDACRTADTSDIRTCEINYKGLVSDLYVYPCTAHKEGLKATYRTQGN